MTLDVVMKEHRHRDLRNGSLNARIHGQLNVPIFAREEDDADQFSAYMMLQSV
jgi:hypothetical protein